jgi:hypothetical protein
MPPSAAIAHRQQRQRTARHRQQRHRTTSGTPALLCQQQCTVSSSSPSAAVPRQQQCPVSSSAPSAAGCPPTGPAAPQAAAARRRGRQCPPAAALHGTAQGAPRAAAKHRLQRHCPQWHREHGGSSVLLAAAHRPQRRSGTTGTPAARRHRTACRGTASPAESPHRLHRHRTACTGTAPPAEAAARGSPNWAVHVRRAPGPGQGAGPRKASAAQVGPGGRRDT